MAQQSTSTVSTILWRFFTLVALLAVLLQLQRGGQLQRAVSYISNYSYGAPVAHPPAPRPAPAPAPAVRVIERVIYRSASPTLAQVQASRQLLESIQQLRREVAALKPVKPAPAPVAHANKPVVMALTDSVVVKRRPSGQLTATVVKTAAYSDKWLSLTGVVKPGQAGRPDSLAVNYQIRNEYDVAAWSKREPHRWWPFGKRRIYVTLTSRNPKSVDKGLDAIPVSKARKAKKTATP